VVHTLDEARQQLATLHVELKSGVTQAQPAKEAPAKGDLPKKHHIK
jgi:hypothetical protein